MPREVTVNLGGEERRLMFGAARAAVEVEKRLKKAPILVLDQDLSPHRHESAYSIVSLAAMLRFGLIHEDKRLTEETVLDWLDEAFKTEDFPAVVLCAMVRDAMLLSGICGFTRDLMAPEEPEKKGDGDEGKAPAVKAAE